MLYITVLNVASGPTGLRVLLPAILVALPARLLHRRPLPVFALMLAGSFAVTTSLHSLDTGYSQALVVDLAVGFIAANRPPRISIVAAVTALGTQVAGVPYYTAGNNVFTASVAVIALAIVTAWTIGHSIRERRDHAEVLRSQATAQAVSAERLRIARELHDMVAHSIGIIAIQAGVGSRVIDTHPAEARNALRAIEATSRETLSGLRRMLGALRRAERDPAALARPPGLAELDQLAASTTNAGVRVNVQRRGEQRPIPADIDLSAFRIIQEALTNVVRHADAHNCRVTVDYRDDELSIEVTDDGRGCAVEGTGYGIVGMRERVVLLHGQFTAGPGPEGGFRVSAQMPVPAGAR